MSYFSDKFLNSILDKLAEEVKDYSVKNKIKKELEYYIISIENELYYTQLEKYISNELIEQLINYYKSIPKNGKTEKDLANEITDRMNIDIIYKLAIRTLTLFNKDKSKMM